MITLGWTPARAAFIDVTDANLLLPAPGVTYGLGWGDFDLDGDRDCFVCRHFLRPIVYENQNDGTMTYALFPGLFDSPDDHHGGLVADIDQDGDLDIYLTGGADAGTSTVPKKMYRNDGNLVFTNVAMQWGLADSLARGRSPSAMDVEGDGDVDIFVAKSSRALSPNSLFVNDGAQNFTDKAAAAGIADDFGSVGGLWADYDNDGDPDLLISGEEEASFETRLYRNDGSLMFTDVTELLPATDQLGGADWGDYDNDGDLDLAAGLGDLALFDAISWGTDSLTFYFNTRSGDNGLDGLAFLQTADSATYAPALDGYFQPDRIFIGQSKWNPATVPFTLHFQNGGSPSFLPGDPAAFYIWTQSSGDIWQLRCTAPTVESHSFAGLITTTGTFTDVSAVGLEAYTHGPRGTRLWRNDGGVFTDVTSEAGLKDSVNVHCVQWVDVNQDGRLDLYVLDKGDTELHNRPNVFYRNLGGGSFADETLDWQLEGPMGGLGDAFSFEDYDDDGDLDLMLTSGSGPVFIADEERVRLYRNDSLVGKHVRVDLVGTVSTLDGYGAWVTCVGSAAGRQTHYVTGNTWRGASGMLDPYFGLGSQTHADSIIVQWPSGSVDIRTNVPANTTVVITETDPAVAAGEGAPAGRVPLALVPSPQPSAAGVSLALAGRGDAEAELDVFDTAGRRVWSARVAAGTTRVRWDGRGRDGSVLASGVYFVRLREGDRVAHAKVVRVRP